MGDADPSPADESPDLVYEPNPKHKPVQTPGRRGSICPPDVSGPDLLMRSDLVGAKRYATDGRGAYCAQEHQPGRWHGYPVDWEEVPPKLVFAWVAEQKVKRHVTRHRPGRRRPR
jgi:hypothetical protein